jgi:protocatechuate 3,4-dioxygenase beta subunit
LALLSASATLSAAEQDVIRFKLRTRIGEAAPIDVQLAVPFGTSQRVPAGGALTYYIEIAPPRDGRVFAKLRLDDFAGNPLPRTTNGLPLAAGETRSVSFTVCSERVILQESVPATPARCADLPAMATVDPRPDGCIECIGAYEGMPRHFESHARIAPANEPGERLVLTGRTLAPDGSPRAGVIVYAFQTDRTGIYPAPEPPRSTFSQSHGRLRGWALTDDQGRYTFDTIRPGAYPDRREPEHIHMVVIEPGCATYFIEEIHFSDDPLLADVSPARRETLLSGTGGSGVVTPQRDASGVLHAARDIELGQKFTNYPGCAKPRMR